MSAEAEGHTHDEGEPRDWFAVLDVVVWVAVVVLVIMAVEWLAGYLVREKLARGAQRFLRKESPADAA